MRHYTAEQFREGSQYKSEFYHEYSAKVYTLAYSHVKNEQASLNITKSVFLKAFDTLAVVNYDGDDYWPFLKGYALEEIASYLSGRPLSSEAAGGPALSLDVAQPKSAPSQALSSRRGTLWKIRSTLMFLLNLLLAVVLAWLLVGLLIRLNILPALDLGYTWFNDNIFQLF
ncbi:MAG: hypothetical protein VB049_11930 [Candidatus Pelethousia sp.]|nr:hypothetical protein [Candidatus Pelethousia sp.]